MRLLDTLGDAILDTRSDAIIAADVQGVIRFWNPGAERIFGYETNAALGRSLDIIIPERLRKLHWDGYCQVMKTGESRYGRGDVLAVPAIRQDGSTLSIEFTIVPQRDAEGRLVGMAAILRDVTARFEAVRGLRKKLAETEARIPK